MRFGALEFATEKVTITRTDLSSQIHMDEMIEIHHNHGSTYFIYLLHAHLDHTPAELYYRECHPPKASNNNLVFFKDFTSITLASVYL